MGEGGGGSYRYCTSIESLSMSKLGSCCRLAPTSTPEERLAATRDAIMEDGSIFNDLPSTSIKSSTSNKSINSKEQKIDEFKRVSFQ